MKPRFHIVFIYILISIVEISFQKVCGKEDIGKIISDCDHKSQREIFFYWKNECTQNSVNLPSKKINDNCNIDCKAGEFVDYSVDDNLLKCNKCPIGTYSLGGSRNIKKWDETILSEFSNNCYVIINDELKSNEKCDRFKVNQMEDGNTSLQAGGLLLNLNAMYSYELIHNVNFKKKGKITFTFKKSTYVSNKYVNGQFNFYIDYDLKFQNHNEEFYTSKNSTTVSFEIEKGSHNFMWQYTIWGDSNQRPLFFELLSIDLEGCHMHDYECTPCDKVSESFEQCKACPEGQFHDFQTNSCASCAIDEYVFGSNKSKSDCLKKPICNEDFVVEEHNGICDQNSMEQVSYKYDEDKICLQPNSGLRSLQSLPVPLPSGDAPFDVKRPSGLPAKSSNFQGSPTATMPKKPKNQTESDQISILTKNENTNSELNIKTLDSQSKNCTVEDPTFILTPSTSSDIMIEKGLLPPQKLEKCKKCNNGYFMVSKSENSTSCINCQGNTFFNKGTSSCLECPEGTSSIKLLTISGHSQHARSQFIHNHCYSEKDGKLLENKGCAGWVFRSHGITSGSRNLNRVKKILVKKVQVKKFNTAFMNLEFYISELDPTHKEEFIVKINNSKESFKNFSLEKNIKKITRRYPLYSGENEISFIYSRDSSISTPTDVDKYSVIIRKLEIQGSNEGSGISCSDCDKSSIKVISEGQVKCKSCPIGKTPNDKKDECIVCPVGFISDNCNSCPKFTHINKSGTCELKHTLHNKKVALNFDMSDFNKKIDTECSDHNEICYNSFLGPIKGHTKGDLFFMSYGQRNLINVTDFSYNVTDSFIPDGHVFALFNQKSHKDEKHFENTKILKNIGNQISRVQLIYALDQMDIKALNIVELNSIFSNSGIMIEYSNGEYCRDSTKFKSYLFMYCDKNSSNHSPRLAKISDDGCTFFFEIKSVNLCPICTKFQTIPFTTACIRNQRAIIFQETENCRIIKENQLSHDSTPGYEDYNFDTILSHNQTLLDSDLKFYFDIHADIDYYLGPTYKSLTTDQLSTSDSSLYLTKGDRLDEECTVIDNFSSYEMYILFMIPFIWLGTGLCVLLFYCKYKRARHDYDRLREERELVSMGGTSRNEYEGDNQLQLEVSN